MNITTTGKNIEVTDAMRSYIEEKMTQLQKYSAELARIDVEVDKNMHHKKGEVFHVRVNAQVPRELLHAEAAESDVYASIDIVRDHIAHQLQNYGAKKDDHKRRAAKTRRDWKSILAFWK